MAANGGRTRRKAARSGILRQRMTKAIFCRVCGGFSCHKRNETRSLFRRKAIRTLFSDILIEFVREKRQTGVGTLLAGIPARREFNHEDIHTRNRRIHRKV